VSKSSHVLCRRCRKRPAHRAWKEQICEPCWRELKGEQQRGKRGKAKAG